MKLTVSTSNIITAKRGIVYVLEIDLEGKKLVKVGLTHRPRVEDRVCEILVSIWKRYRVFPQCTVKRYSSFNNPAAVEKRLHKELKEFRYTPKFSFSGSTEFFDISLNDVVSLYEDVTD
jgi:hypothetical protein